MTRIQAYPINSTGRPVANGLYSKPVVDVKPDSGSSDTACSVSSRVKTAGSFALLLIAKWGVVALLAYAIKAAVTAIAGTSLGILGMTLLLYGVPALALLLCIAILCHQLAKRPSLN